MTIHGRTGATPPDLTSVRPYGDTLDDGIMQLSFSLPVPFGDEAREAARRLLLAMGLEDPQIYHAADLGDGYTFVIVYARTRATIDFTSIEVAKVAAPQRSKKEIEALVAERVGRDIVVLGACTGTDAHTVGIDAIMNMKGFDGDKGLEAYRGVAAWNLGAQVPNEELVARAIELDADVLLVSQIVTQKDVHKVNLTELVELLEAEGLRERLLIAAGGPRIGHELALELGFDAGFGPGTRAVQVASWMVDELIARGLVERTPHGRRSS
ncbi:MAG: hypothetical protein EA398_12595 [Deltaproteobacteria bacterium]|nr:MAG: hypothetical protein EA398_12595 [Deltaproteobacteria bacterium]